MIQVSELTKSYGSVRALERVTFEVPEREVVGFLGPNGAGKSTTLRILTGYLPGDSGTVRVAGHDVARDSLAVRREIGYMPEGVPLYPEMRVREFLRFRASIKGLAGRERRKEIGVALERAGIANVASRIIGKLSKGYRQRVGLADALLGRPKVLILDEPTVGFDPEQLVQIRGLLREIGRDRTVLLSTHILSEVEAVCSSAIIIQNGRIAAQDTAENLRRRVQDVSPIRVEIDGRDASGNDTRRALEGLDDVESILSARSEQDSRFRTFRLRPVKGKDPREAIFDLARERGWTLRELHRDEVSLEEAFLDIVGEKRRPE